MDMNLMIPIKIQYMGNGQDALPSNGKTNIMYCGGMNMNLLYQSIDGWMETQPALSFIKLKLKLRLYKIPKIGEKCFVRKVIK
jgi:hypothetical protein